MGALGTPAIVSDRESKDAEDEVEECAGVNAVKSQQTLRNGKSEREKHTAHVRQPESAFVATRDLPHTGRPV